MTVCVIGLGKIGLPLAVQFAGGKHAVIGVDLQDSVVAAVNAGREPFEGEANLDVRLAEAVEQGRLRATTDGGSAVAASDIVVIVVPLVVDANAVPDFTVMDRATDVVGRSLRPGTLVSYETTLPLHATRRRFTPRLEELSGLRCGHDLFVCHSPERVLSGRIFFDLRRYPKLVGGVDPASGERAVTFYESVLEFDERPELPRPNGVWNLGSSEAAELAKLAETTYRDLNIAFANELAVVAEEIGIDVLPVIEASNSQPYSHLHRPGVAVGGHCIPVYPHLLLDSAPSVQLPALGRAVNNSMPGRAVDALEKALGSLDGERVVVLGLAYRGGVKEDAFSGTGPLVGHLRERGAVPVVHDPLYSDSELRDRGFEPYHSGEQVAAAILHTDHESYRTLTAKDLPGVRVIYDGRRILDAGNWEGVAVLRIGAPAD